ncbi:HEPN domain-containing protein [Pseudomonas sp. GD04158]|uniref:HEPN domain-containing protein n=1 Tax=Pseudomonas sp. GD04158 TaxID=2975439 RepID=UPI002449929A|nr:HEPN domain-containing protein [Pseudomonas sp. GD04158]MDH0097764.1 HEPN domain-containing protein [Pseudomonas sp. GD04158]
MQFQSLKQRHRQERDAQHPNLRLRVHRALSWLDRAEQADDLDGRFIFLWIAFNAAYATEIDERQRLSEQETFKAFLEKLCSLDESKRIDALVWQEFSGSIRVLLDNPYVFQSFWDHQSGKIDEPTWKTRFASGKRAAQQALASGNTPALLGVLFNRLYTLRNQLIHGGATWNGSVNREQMRDCTSLLGKLVPLIIELMMDCADTLWGDACYPVVDGA